MTIEETKSKLDALFIEVKAYRSSKRFKQLLDFCAHFKTLAPYNAMLVNFQMPHARFVLTPSQWKKYHRKIRSNARPLVILIPFGPVDFVFEIQDTYTSKNAPHLYSESEIIEEVEKPFRVAGRAYSDMLDKLITLMQYHGVAYDPNMVAGVNYGAEISLLTSKEEQIPIDIPINKNISIVHNAHFLVRTNSTADVGQKIASIAHELGHLFCYHLPVPEGWGGAWEYRNLNKDVREFEAEAVARMVCDRLEIVNTSERYLAPYLAKYNEIPQEASVENICLAANKILTMCFGFQKFTYRDGLLFKHDKEFQEIVERIKAANKK